MRALASSCGKGGEACSRKGPEQVHGTREREDGAVLGTIYKVGSGPLWFSKVPFGY